MNDTATKPCFSCGALVPDIKGPVHRYMDSSPGCWKIYGEVLAREYSDQAYWSHHRLTVDSYAVQHPGKPSPQSIKSVAVHLMSIYLILECDIPVDKVTQYMNMLANNKSAFTWLDPPDNLGNVTVLDILRAESSEQHGQKAMEWAASVWNAWEPHHGRIITWADTLQGKLIS